MTETRTKTQKLEITQSDERSGVFFVNIKDKLELYNLYMPFIEGGALFIKTDKVYHLSDEVFLLVKLLEEPEKYPIAGRVVWTTPACAQGGRSAGIGVQFVGEEGGAVRNKIDTYLAGMIKSDRNTETM